MRSPARAPSPGSSAGSIAGGDGTASYVLFMVITGLLGIDSALTSDANVERFIGTIVLPLTAAVLYLLAVFSFGLSGDLAARQSMYPPRLFTLPVTTAALAGWPMFFGRVAMVVLAQASVWHRGHRLPSRRSGCCSLCRCCWPGRRR